MVRAAPATLLLAASLAWPALADEHHAQPAAADPVAALDADPESLPTPPGSRKDQAIWAGTLEASYQHASERGAGRQLLWRAVGGRFDEFLARRAEGETEDARRAAGLRKRLGEAYGQVYRCVTKIWGVDARMGCRSQAIDLEGAMRAAGDHETHELHEARERAEQCTSRARHGAHETREANVTLRAVLDEAEAFLVPPKPQAAPAGLAAPPAPAPAQGR